MKKSNQIIRDLLFFFVVGFLIFVIVLFLNKIFTWKSIHYYALNSDVTDMPYLAEKWDGFYDLKPDSLEAIFIGASLIHTDIDPLTIYHEYGIRTYDLSSDQFEGSYYSSFIKEAFITQNPKVIILDVHSIKAMDRNWESSAHYAYDFMKMGYSKIEGILDLQDVNKMEFVFPILKYHSRWENLEQADFDYLFMKKDNRLRGHFCYMLKNSYVQPESHTHSNISLSDLGLCDTEKTLDEIVEYCDKYDCKVVLLQPPTATYTYADSKFLDALKQYSIENSIEFWNYEDIESEYLVDYENDYVDGLHMNYWGAKRFSVDVGKKLVDHFFANQTIYDKEWEEDWEYYCKLEHDFEIRHYSFLEQYSSDVADGKVLLILTYYNAKDMGAIECLKLKDDFDNMKMPRSIVIYDGKIYSGEYLGDILKCMKIEISKSGKTFIWVNDTDKYETVEADGLIDMIVYGMNSGKVLDHTRIYANNGCSIYHLLNAE